MSYKDEQVLVKQNIPILLMLMESMADLDSEANTPFNNNINKFKPV